MIKRNTMQSANTSARMFWTIICWEFNGEVNGIKILYANGDSYL